MIAAVTTFDSLYTKYCGGFIDPSELVRPLFSSDEHSHLERKYARIFISRHNPLKDANSFPRAKLCKKKGRGLGRSDSVRGQIHDIFTLNGSFCVYHPSNIFSTRGIYYYTNMSVCSFRNTPAVLSEHRIGIRRMRKKKTTQTKSL